jgi:hypothetical protein
MNTMVDGSGYIAIDKIPNIKNIVENQDAGCLFGTFSQLWFLVASDEIWPIIG